MQNLKKLGKKLFTMSVVSMTVAWSVGLSAFVPAGAAAATCPELESGDLFKVSGNSAVYLVNSNMKRMYFPNAEVYNTWYKDFSGITTIESTCVDAYASGGGVNFRPGSRLVKSAVSPSVFAVGPNNMKHKIADEATATALYGSNWNSLVRTLPDVFDSNYSVGAALSSAVVHNGQLVKKSGESTVYYVWDGVLKMVDGTLPTPAAGDVRTVSAAVFSSVSMSSGSVSASTVVNNPTQMSGGSTTPINNGGSLNVGLAADTPAASTLAASTVYNNMLKVTVTAGGNDVNVKGVTVTRTGLSLNSYVGGVSVWDSAGNRHGDVMSSFNSDNKVTIGFGSNPIKVSKGSSTTFTVAFNIASTGTSGTLGASVASAADIMADGTVTGSFPVVGNTMSLVSGTSVADVQLGSNSAGGLSTEPGSSTAGNLEIGQTQEIAKIKFIQNDGASDVQVNKVTFYVQGSAKDKDLKNFEVLAPDNTVLGTTEWMSDRYVTVNFTKPYTVPKSVNRVLTLRATVADGSGNWFRVQVQNDYDVMVKDLSTGYYIAPTNEGCDPAASCTTAYTAVSSSAGYFKMKSGALTISKASDSPSLSVSAGANDVVLGRFNVKAVGEDLEIRKLSVKIATSTPTQKGLTGSLKLRVGSDILLTTSASDTTYTLYNSATTEYTLSQYLNLKSGETKVLEVLGSVPTTATSGASYQALVGNMYGKRLSTLDYAEDLGSASANIAANALAVEATSVTLAKDSTLGNMTRSAGSTQVLAQYTVKAGSAEDIKLTNFTVQFAGLNAWDTPAHLQNLEVWVDGTQFGSTIGSAATSSNSFLGNQVIPKNTVKTVMIKGLLNSSASGSVSTTVASFTYVGVDTQNTSSDTNSGSLYVGQTTTVGAANVVVSAANDDTTINNVLTPNVTPVQVGKWKLEAQNEAVTLKKITFNVNQVVASVATGVLNTTSSDYGIFYLYDSANMTTALAQGQFVGGTSNAYVQFSGLNLAVAADAYKYLVVKAAINGSGTMTPANMSYLTVRSDSSSEFEITASSGGTLAASQIDAGTGESASGAWATSTVHLFHNAVPTIAPGTLPTTLELSATAPIFKYTVTNPGDRELRLGSTTVKVSVSGLAGTGSATGTIGTFKLYTANSSGGLGQLLASTSSCIYQFGESNIAGCGELSANTLSIAFGLVNQEGTALANLVVPAGSSRTFIVTADTTDSLDGKSSGSVSVSSMFDGATGFTFSGGWAAGVVDYYYVPVNNSGTEVGPFTASDSFDVIGSTLVRTL